MSRRRFRAGRHPDVHRRPRAAPATMNRSPSRSDPAPVVTTRSPSLRPSRISTCVASSMPTRTGRNVAVSSLLGEKDAAAAAEIDDRVDGHDQRVFLLVGRDADAGVHARLEARGRIRDLDLDRRGARRGVEHRRHACDAAHELLAGKRIDLDDGFVAGADLLEILFDDVGDQTHAADVHDVGNRRVLSDERAGVNGAARHEAVDRRHDDRVGQRDAKLVEPRVRLVVLRAREIELRDGGLIARLGIVERLLRQQLTREQIARPLGVGQRQLEVGLALADGRLRDFLRGFRPA